LEIELAWEFDCTDQDATSMRTTAEQRDSTRLRAPGKEKRAFPRVASLVARRCVVQVPLCADGVTHLQA
jgi:hypothetical protein